VFQFCARVASNTAFAPLESDVRLAGSGPGWASAGTDSAFGLEVVAAAGEPFGVPGREDLGLEVGLVLMEFRADHGPGDRAAWALHGLARLLHRHLLEGDAGMFSVRYTSPTCGWAGMIMAGGPSRPTTQVPAVVSAKPLA
jgi:hypothetical protein